MHRQTRCAHGREHANVEGHKRAGIQRGKAKNTLHHNSPIQIQYVKNLSPSCQLICVVCLRGREKEFSRKVVHILNSKTQNCVDVAAAQSLCTEPGESKLRLNSIWHANPNPYILQTTQQLCLNPSQLWNPDLIFLWHYCCGVVNQVIRKVIQNSLKKS